MNRLTLSCLFMSLFLFLFSTYAIFYNQTVTHYIGNEYIPYESYLLVIPLCLMWQGFRLLSIKHLRLEQMLQSAIVMYLFLCLFVYLSTAVQYTPFPIIDEKLIRIDAILSFQTNKALNVVYQYPLLQKLLTFCYLFLDWELLFIYALIVFLPPKPINNDFYFLMLITALIGCIFYYFFPTTGPASHLNNPHFFREQYDTGKKFYEIHHHLRPTTLEGGLIAMPSYHSVWALISQYYLKRIPLLWYLLLPINLLILLSCILLGWHYLIDIIAATGLVLLGIGLLRLLKSPSMILIEDNVT